LLLPDDAVQLAVLMYHALDRAGSPVSIDPRTFERQLGRLGQAGYSVLPLSEALGVLMASPAQQRRLAALTFDDGYASVYTTAAPMLAHYGWRATIFAVTGYLGADNRWPAQAAYVPPAPLLTWDQLELLASQGWEVGAHTRTHPDLTALESDQQVADEILGSKHDLEARLGQPISAFAYPSGRYDNRVRSVVRRHFDAACTTNMGWASATSPMDALDRIEMWDFSRPGASHLIGTPLMGAYVAACGAVRRLKSR
jgi:peptidoglycan/xylan/chitin deacetylase (PgdA/CDA1 family)